MSATPVSFRQRRETLSNVVLQSHRIDPSALPSLRDRKHMALPASESNFDLLMVSIPESFQQGIVPDGKEPDWGLLRIAAAGRERDGLKIGILDANRIGISLVEIRRQLEKITPKVVGLNPLSVNVPESKAIAGICNELGISYIVGGVHATIDPAVARADFPDAAAIVKGNGASAIGELVRAIINGSKIEIQGVYPIGHFGDVTAYAPVLQVNSVPKVDQALLVEQPVYRHTVTINGSEVQLSEATLFVTQGCAYRCANCVSPLMINRDSRERKPYERQSSDRIVGDVMDCITDLGANGIHFLNDMTFASEANMTSFYKGLRDESLLGRFVWRGLSRANILDNFSDATVELMRESGAWRITLGIESGSDEVLRKQRRRMTVAQIMSAVEKLSRHRIEQKGFFIMGYPGETEAQMMQTYALMQTLKNKGMAEVSVFQYHPYPGTEDYTNLLSRIPDLDSRLPYLDKTRNPYEPSPNYTWLPNDLSIAAVPSWRVRELVTAAMDDFYS